MRISRRHGGAFSGLLSGSSRALGAAPPRSPHPSELSVGRPRAAKRYGAVLRSRHQGGDVGIVSSNFVHAAKGSSELGQSHGFVEREKEPCKNDPWRRLSRHAQSAIFGLRTEHTGLAAHLTLLNPRKEPSCSRCGSSAGTVVHFLVYCPTLRELRERLLPGVPSLQDCLWVGLEQLKGTSRFYDLVTRGIRL